MFIQMNSLSTISDEEVLNMKTEYLINSMCAELSV